MSRMIDSTMMSRYAVGRRSGEDRMLYREFKQVREVMKGGMDIFKPLYNTVF